MENPSLDHGARPLKKDRDLFAPPPPELGPILSAASTLAVGQQPRSFFARYAITVFIAGSVFIAVYLLMYFSIGASNAANEKFLIFFPPCLLATIALIIVWIQSRFRPTCTYVCRDGIARFTCLGVRDAIQSEILHFADADALHVYRTRVHVHVMIPIYLRTNFRFDFQTTGGVFGIAGSYFSPGLQPNWNKPGYRFALAAENAWTAFLLPRYEATIATGQPAAFPVNNGDELRVGTGFVEYITGGKTIRFDSLTTDEIFWINGALALDCPGRFFRKKIESSKIANTAGLSILLARYAFASAPSAVASNVATASPTLEGLLTDMMNKPPS